MKFTKIISLVLGLCMLLSLSACLDVATTQSFDTADTVLSEGDSLSGTNPDNKIETARDDDLIVHYLDVGQGDSIFIEFPDNTCMLIDASIAQYEKKIESKIRQLGYSKIDYVIATHPHADHIGGMTHILNSFEIGCIYLPNVSASTKTYVKMAETILEKNIPANIAQAGVQILDKDGVRAKILAPYEIDDSDQNKNSAVLYISYEETSFLFMGDADAEIEKQIEKIDCDVLKVGPHGSRTASDASFLKTASPLYAIISCGEGNSYGHPHKEAVDRLSACGANILRTDLLGDILIKSNGKSIEFITVNENDKDQSDSEDEISDEISNEQSKSNEEKNNLVLNTNSKKIHDPLCIHVKNISAQNKVETNQSLDELLEQGYSPCGTCNPHN